MAALILQVYKCFPKFVLRLQNLKETKNTQQALGKCCGNPLGKFLNFKIVYFVLFLSQNTIVIRIFFDFYFVAIYQNT